MNKSPEHMPDAADDFERLAKNLLAVPKKELDEKEAEYQMERERVKAEKADTTS